jgi:hypothetical protein
MLQQSPISPELVLVDPELARRERARLEEKAYLESIRDVAIRDAFEQQPTAVEESTQLGPRWSERATGFRRRLVPVALLCSLLANGYLAAHLVVHSGDSPARVAVRITAPKAPPSAVAATVATAQLQPPGSTQPTTPVLSTKSAVERTVVSLVLSAPARKLPDAFIDPTTGLVKNNVHVACGGTKRRSFLCTIRLPSDSTSKVLYVRYRIAKNGRGVFNWNGYRPR